jgi:hypothetical protein
MKSDKRPSISAYPHTVRYDILPHTVRYDIFPHMIHDLGMTSHMTERVSWTDQPRINQNRLESIASQVLYGHIPTFRPYGTHTSNPLFHMIHVTSVNHIHRYHAI